MRFLTLGLSAFLLTATSALAIEVNVKGSAQWSSWSLSDLAAPGSAGTAFWNNNSNDGPRCNVGFWLTGTQGCSSGNNSSIEDAGTSNTLNYLSRGGNRSANVNGFSFSSTGQNSASLKVEVAGSQNINSFGWYATGSALTSSSQLNQLFSGSAGPGSDSALFPSTGSLSGYAFYLINDDGRIFTTEGNSYVRNRSGRLVQRANARAFSLFSGDSAAGRFSGSTSLSSFYMGMEDLRPGSAGSDRDFSDLIIRVSEVPEPLHYTVLLSGLLAAGLWIRRRRHNLSNLEPK